MQKLLYVKKKHITHTHPLALPTAKRERNKKKKINTFPPPPTVVFRKKKPTVPEETEALQAHTTSSNLYLVCSTCTVYSLATHCIYTRPVSSALGFREAKGG